MTMRTIVLPRLVGTRELARTLVHEAPETADQGSRAVLSARAVDVAAPSFLDELVVVLKDAGVSEIVLQGASDDLATSLQSRADLHGGITVEKQAA